MNHFSIPTANSYFGSPAEVLDPMVRASRYAGRDTLTARLIEIRTWLQDDLATLEREIIAPLPEVSDLGQRAAVHLLGLPGKRVRPLCVVLAARAGGAPFNDAVKQLAIACELVHSATLLHDDVLDEGSERRGAVAARLAYGNSASVLGGDYLLVDALRRVYGTGEHGLLSDLMDVIDGMVKAEVAQLERRGKFDADRDAYLEIIYGKTAAIFEWGLRAGGVAGGLSEEAAQALGKYGAAIGMAFQVVDDILDLAGESDVIGKDSLVDIKEGKLTWPLIIACEREPSIEVCLREIACTPEALDETYAKSLRQRILDTGALDEARRRARLCAEQAQQALEMVPASKSRDALSTVIEAVVNRGL